MTKQRLNELLAMDNAVTALIRYVVKKSMSDPEAVEALQEWDTKRTIKKELVR